MQNKLFFIFLVPFFLFSQDIELNNNLPNDVKWVTHSIEYKKLCEQIYRSAALSIRNRVAVSDKPVIVMDLDETVLDNSQYQVELYLKSEKFQLETWNKWVEKEVSTLVPGSKKFKNSYPNCSATPLIWSAHFLYAARPCKSSPYLTANASRPALPLGKNDTGYLPGPFGYSVSVNDSISSSSIRYVTMFHPSLPITSSISDLKDFISP